MNRSNIYDSAACSSPILDEFSALIDYRDLVLQLIARSVKTRYKRSFLGVAWTMVNPLLTLLVLTIVFASIFRFPMKNYALFVLSGLLIWNFFAQSTSAAMNDLIWSGGLLSRIYMPKSAFTFAAIGTGLVNLILALIPYMLISLILGNPIQAAVLFLPIPILFTAMFALGIGLAVSAVAIYFPDVMPMYDVLLTAWMYLTPAIYPIDQVAENIQVILRLNPMYYYVEAFRTILYEGKVPSIEILLIGFLVGIVSLIFGWVVFNRRARDYAYRI